TTCFSVNPTSTVLGTGCTGFALAALHSFCNSRSLRSRASMKQGVHACFMFPKEGISVGPQLLPLGSQHSKVKIEIAEGSTQPTASLPLYSGSRGKKLIRMRPFRG